jgi:hypothetical protein
VKRKIEKISYFINMRTCYLLLSVLFQSCISFAQPNRPEAGIYLNANDFIAQRLSFSVDPESNGNSISPDPLFQPAYVIIKRSGQKIKIPKKKLYGYRDAHGNMFRFCRNDLYQIVDTTGFYVYKHRERVLENKGYRFADVYYFSRNANDRVLKLSVRHLVDAFPEDLAFHYALKYWIQRESELTDLEPGGKGLQVTILYQRTRDLE